MLSQNPEESASFVAFLYPSERTCPSWAAFSMTQTFTIPTNAEVYRNKASTSSRLLATFSETLNRDQSVLRVRLETISKSWDSNFLTCWEQGFKLRPHSSALSNVPVVVLVSQTSDCRSVSTQNLVDLCLTWGLGSFTWAYLFRSTSPFYFNISKAEVVFGEMSRCRTFLTSARELQRVLHLTVALLPRELLSPQSTGNKSAGRKFLPRLYPDPQPQGCIGILQRDKRCNGLLQVIQRSFNEKLSF